MKHIYSSILLVTCHLAMAQVTPIYDIQGNGPNSPYDTQTVTTEGIVVGDFQDLDQLSGFFIQDATGDADLTTSDGIFVYDPNGTDVTVGDHVTVSGTVDEFFGMTEIVMVTSIVINSSGNPAVPLSIAFPLASMDAFEAIEGMLVQIPNIMIVSENFDQARYAELTISGNSGLPPQPTNYIDPNDDPASGTTTSGNSNVANIHAQTLANDLNSIAIDDGSTMQYPSPQPWINPVDSTIRCGETSVQGIMGCINYSFGEYKLTPTSAPNFDYGTRPLAPEFPSANVNVAAFNVLNYWTTLDDGNNGARGADSPTELIRQRDKLVATIAAMDADVLGLMELESNGTIAINDLVAAINAEMGAGTYVVNPDPSTTGIDVIKTVIIYKPSVVTPVGGPITSGNPIHERPPVAQTFQLNSNAGMFNFIAVHYRYKGCSGATGLDEDQNDGQACFNETRRQESFSLLNLVDSIQSLSGDLDVLIAGDFNAYKQEDPIDILRADGLVDLVPVSHTSSFLGEWGALDHAFVNSAMNVQVLGAEVWNCNSNEPRSIDYNEEFNSQDLYSVNPYRSSDHDPLVIGLNVIGSIGVSAVERVEEFLIFPVPAKEILHFKFNAPAKSVRILDLNGKLMRTEEISVATEHRIDLSALPPGTYIAQVDLMNGSSAQRQFIVQH